jgi:threonine/homoserine/homoserine lactone efflux protein
LIQYLVIGITYAFAAVIQPGPFQVFLLNQILSKGWKRTLPAAFGPLISDLPVIVITLFLLNTVPHKMISLLQAAGGLFLLYLAAGSFRAWKNNIQELQAASNSHQETLMKAVLVNLLNPNPYIGWSLVLGPLLIKGWHESPVNGIVLIAAFYITLVTGMIITIIIFGTTGKLNPKVNRMLKGLAAIALACFGLYELFVGFHSYFSA